MASLLKSQQYDQLRQELNFGLQDVLPQQLGFELTRDLRPSGRQLPVAVNTMGFPGAPVQAIGGDAQISGNEIHTPRIELRNISRRPVRSVDMGWIVRDERGRDFVAGSVPAAMPLGPVQTAVANETGTLRFSNASGQPLTIGALMAFVSNVEFEDGNLWIPSRTDINEATTRSGASEGAGKFARASASGRGVSPQRYPWVGGRTEARRVIAASRRGYC